VTSRHRGRRTVFGLLSWPVLVIGIAGVLFTLFALSQAGSDRHESWTQVMANAVGFGLVAGFMASTCLVRVVGVDGHTVRLVNMLFMIDVPVDQIARIDTTKGLQVVATDGRSFGSTAFGSSVLGSLLGYRRANRVAERCRAWLELHGGSAETRQPIRRRVRPACYLLAGLGPLSYCGVASVLFLIRR
jgi:hypothetical protein